MNLAGARQSERGILPRAASFWILAVLFLMLFFASAAASPLYPVYQAQFRFSAATLTAVFAVYVLVLLVTGRRGNGLVQSAVGRAGHLPALRHRGGRRVRAA